MPTLILVVLSGILAALFATQNTDPVSIIVASYTLNDIPMYLIVLGSLLLGLLLSSIISLVNSISSSFTLHGKDAKIKETKKTLVELTKQIHQLELENARLKEHTTFTDEKSL
ncbi:hypothetical protein A2862_01575 [Candidatus Roizmanbacteria bacterium RIFCSPHIGHO2_01_FULL_38_41]|uniref:Lipopolysaccharide assembly protein A domain-containing protein n=1 Tax=Candidatus Roizmanbacteria bacterium RIFCSPHIGHO2_02_FULL_37_24 TaxID=1802037 RepID=A0A1F7GVQ4_9BACT|nr:MAG: hypothetical protein A2862_01575 [Candidatus Roizmanbacteria bacterium RIFCSPHIGHO2_01_FULL_38_41]OGK22895.1 MAG: hypothetical protein A3C24_03455 [Candidatus Roizmanbacteria bacterium RIFCSPHIGHO2_02_FULL_37_24]OGK32450.1 MAG: hypothetical protein A3E10_03960 [Candidatus Roizmanbacteria bacterium RIFCSPHIGHO2_12_FULL_37_23]OGK44625.1 MAG: hypothetical protein A2956_03870 [Candidatus Roizmanbacteria bacterium RIFCSPLOWO2_01_FULL_37_57]OGK58941.1 MAG: hypothetical protein A3G65_04330 [Ca